ncbi:MAG: hypothetical protein JW779_15820 [Candidatus Thorarchaeota archaeon]|nr:hypothetical protein [Candidatus Thorarchaeota archaeon]
MTKEKKQNESSKRIREEILGMLELELGKKDESPQMFSVMTRLSSEHIDTIDTLVRLGIFKSRSEAIAAIVIKTLNASSELFQQLKDHANEQEKLEQRVKELAIKALLE